MKPLLSSLLRTAAAALAISAALPALAAPVTTAQATFGFISFGVAALGAAGASGNQVTFQAQAVNNIVIDGIGAPIPNTLNVQLQRNITGVSSDASGTTYTFSGLTSASETLAFGSFPDTASFVLGTVEAFVAANDVTALIFRGTKTLASDGALGYDFGGIGRQFTFQSRITGDINFNTVLANGGTPTVPLTGSIVNVGAVATAVPEPGSLGLVLAAGGAGFAVVRRRGQKA